MATQAGEARAETPRLAYTISESAHALGTSRQGVYRLLKARKLRSVRLFKRQRIPASELERLLNE